MNCPSKLIAIVDDDESVREALPDLLRELKLDAVAFDSAEALLSDEQVRRFNCLILDIAMPGMTGPELHKRLLDENLPIPVIFITAHEDEGMRAKLLRQGAVECLFKPFGERELRAALDRALADR